MLVQNQWGTTKHPQQKYRIIIFGKTSKITQHGLTQKHTPHKKTSLKMRQIMFMRVVNISPRRHENPYWVLFGCQNNVKKWKTFMWHIVKSLMVQPHGLTLAKLIKY
jgi:hypothetical protein